MLTATLCVLVLEDDALLQNAFRRMLKRRGYGVITVSTVAECRRVLAGPLSETRSLPDVLLLDREVPDGDGWALKDEAPEGVRVVLMTGNPPPDAPPHLLKPFGVPDLIAAVEGS